eukprot:m.70160 g.70160  ORF g.70160 m.70160 type:complete len:52 (+) comp8626_c0_seq4:129-284(+)
MECHSGDCVWLRRDELHIEAALEERHGYRCSAPTCSGECSELDRSRGAQTW